MAKTVLRIGSRLDLGSVRDNQEDSLRIYLPEQQAVQEEKGALFIVADGVGGHQAGDVASALAIEVLTDAYYASPAPTVEDALRDAITAANTRIYTEAQARASQAGMGSTCVCIALRGSHIGIANVGDSRAYILRGGQLTQITIDHSWVAEQVRSGQLTQDEANASQFRSVLTQALGSAEQVEPSVRGQSLRAGDTLLLCSDGLTAMLEDNEIAAFLAQHDDPQDACDYLTDAANHRGGRDNISIIIVKVDSLQVEAADSEPADTEATIAQPTVEAATAAVSNERDRTAPQRVPANRMSPAARNTLAHNTVASRSPTAAATFAPVEEPPAAPQPSRLPILLLVVGIAAVILALYIIFRDAIDRTLDNIGSNIGLAPPTLLYIVAAIILALLLLIAITALRGNRPVPPTRTLSPSLERDSTAQQQTAANLAPTAAYLDDTPPLPTPAITDSTLAAASPARTITVQFPFGHETYDIAAVLDANGNAVGSCLLSASAQLLGSVDELGKPASRGFWLTLYDKASGQSEVAVLLSPRAYAEEWSAISGSLPQDPMVRFAEIRQIELGLSFSLTAGQITAAVSLLECHYLVAGRQRTPDRYIDSLTLRCDITST